MRYIEEEDLDLEALALAEEELEAYEKETEEIVIEDETMEEIRAVAAERGESPDVILAEFIEYLKELDEQTPPERKEEQRDRIRALAYYRIREELREAGNLREAV
jgi:hypothetical protein